MNIIIIEDDAKTASFVSKGLQQAGFNTVVAPDGKDGLFKMQTGEFDVAIIDIMLPGMDGFTVIQKLREAKITTPVIVLSAKNSVEDKVRGLQAGGDDYLAKPFSFTELLARIQALLRRAGREQPSAEKPVALVSGDVTLWPDRREVTVGGNEVQLTMREFDLLEFLMRSPGVVFSRETLLQRVWGWDFDGGSRTVDVHVQQIRAKLGKTSDLIETVRGVWYRVRG